MCSCGLSPHVADISSSLWNWVNNLIEVRAAEHSKKIETAPSFYAMIRLEMQQ